MCPGKWPALQCCWRSGCRNLQHWLRWFPKNWIYNIVYVSISMAVGICPARRWFAISYFFLFSGAQCLAPARASSGSIIPPCPASLSFTLFVKWSPPSCWLLCNRASFWCVRVPEDEIRYCHRASIAAVSKKAQQMLIFARTKPRGIVNDTHNNQRITEPNMVKDFNRELWYLEEFSRNYVTAL